MHRTTLLQIATALALVQYTAHAWLFLSATPKHGQEEVRLLEAMKSHTWNFGGVMRSYWNFYYGSGLMLVLWGVIEVVLLWQLATVAGVSSVSVTPLIITLLVASIGHGVLALRYFFPLPVVFDVLVAVVLVLSLATT